MPRKSIVFSVFAFAELRNNVFRRKASGLQTRREIFVHGQAGVEPDIFI